MGDCGLLSQSTSALAFIYTHLFLDSRNLDCTCVCFFCMGWDSHEPNQGARAAVQQVARESG